MWRGLAHAERVAACGEGPGARCTRQGRACVDGRTTWVPPPFFFCPPHELACGLACGLAFGTRGSKRYTWACAPRAFEFETKTTSLHSSSFESRNELLVLRARCEATLSSPLRLNFIQLPKERNVEPVWATPDGPEHVPPMHPVQQTAAARLADASRLETAPARLADTSRLRDGPARPGDAPRLRDGRGPSPDGPV